MIEIEKLVVYFNRGTPAQTQALKEVSLNIYEGQFVIVIGGNGAGKSTLLNSICGETKVHSGKIKMDGIDISKWSIPQRASIVGRVFQDPMVGTCADLSVEENLSLALYRGKKRGFGQAIHKKEEELFYHSLAKLNLGLEHRLKDPIGLLSGGQRQAISLMMSTLSPLKILMLDEHTAALDPKTTAFILNITQQLITELHLTAMMVTHSLSQAIEFGNRLIMMKEGQIVLDLDEQQKKKLKVADLINAFNEI